MNNQLTLKDIINLGEYDPEILSKYPEWENLSKYARFQLISQGLENRRKQLFRKWAEINNFMNDSNNMEGLMKAKTNIEEQFKQLRIAKEKLYVEYSGLD